LNKLAYPLAGFLYQDGAVIVGGLACRFRSASEPRPIGVAVEVVARLDGAIYFIVASIFRGRWCGSG
jgi:hypothetical protein